ncbi:MAG: aspartate aminotransferase family protein [Verrucomicrobia bacterium]|nr:aspartate aminotransferase family protein [Verrucomicrobiota bacterium]
MLNLEPKAVPEIRTRFRHIITDLPAPGSLPILRRLNQNEPRAMFCQAPVLWDRARDFQVYDAFGNMWLDWTSGVLVANVGHANPKVKQAIVETVQNDLLHTFAFPNAIREALIGRLIDKAPPPLDKVYLFTTGSETTECAIKLARTYGQTLHPDKIVILTFENAFHGRTLGAQMAGGIPSLKRWIKEPAPGFYQVPFPDGFRTQKYTFSDFLGSIARYGLDPHRIAGVMLESYQGGGASFAPIDFVQSLRAWCDAHEIQLIFDEVQAGFGRTGRYFAFEHYQVVPDMICCGKGMSSSLPISALIGKSVIMDLQEAGEMTSTHAGNPVCCAAALASLEIIDDEDLVEKAENLGRILHEELGKLDHGMIGAVHGKGLVAGLHIVAPTTGEPDSARAAEIVYQCFIRGLLLFAPLGFAGATIKICPPLTITEEALKEGVEVLDQAVRVVLKTPELVH